MIKKTTTAIPTVLIIRDRRAALPADLKNYYLAISINRITDNGFLPVSCDTAYMHTQHRHITFRSRTFQQPEAGHV